MLTTEGDDIFWEGESIAASGCDPNSSCHDKQRNMIGKTEAAENNYV
jgi:hypothetical protein